MSAPTTVAAAPESAATPRLAALWSAIDDAMSRRFLAHGFAVCLVALLPALILFRPKLQAVFFWDLAKLGGPALTAAWIATLSFGAVLIAAALVPRRRKWRLGAVLVGLVAWCVLVGPPIVAPLGRILGDAPSLSGFVAVLLPLVGALVVCVAVGARVRADAPASSAGRVLLAVGSGLLLAVFLMPLPIFGWTPLAAALVRVWFGVGRELQLIVTATIVPGLVLLLAAAGAVAVASTRPKPDGDSADLRRLCWLIQKGALLATPVFVALFAGSTLGGGVAALLFVSLAVAVYAGLHGVATACTALVAEAVERRGQRVPGTRSE